MKNSCSDMPFIYEAFMELPLATAIYDNSNLNIGFANSKMLDIWYCKSDILDHPFSEVFPGFTKDGYADLLENVWDSGVAYDASERAVYIYNGDIKIKRYFNFEYKPLLDKRGQTNFILHTATDITEEICARELQDCNPAFAENPFDLRMVTYTLSHDAKNPLALAKLGINLLKKQIEMPPLKRKEVYDLINKSLGNINDIIDRTVDLTLRRRTEPRREFIQLDELLTAWCREAKLLAQSPHTCIILGHLVPLQSDPSILYQIFTNLINNAVKYSSANKKAQVEIFSTKVKNGTVYIIKDNGIGIPQRQLEQIYQDGHRCSNASSYQGKGVGLFIVKEVLNRLHGRMSIFSKEERGTEVRLFFPDEANPSIRSV